MLKIEDFLNYLRYERNCSALTVLNYGEDLKDFEVFFKSLEKDIAWESVDADIVSAWMEQMIEKGNAATSVNRRLSAVRSFFRYALTYGLVEVNPARTLKGPKVPKMLPKFLKEREMDRLLDDIEWSDSYEDVRARTIIVLFYSTGIRLAELIAMNDADVDWGRSEIKVTGKRNKQRIVPFGNELKTQLRYFIDCRGKYFAGSMTTTDPALFLTAKGKRMKPEQVREEVKKRLSVVTTMSKRSPHVLRHTFATVMLNHDAGIESVKKFLGHANLKTTEIYTHTTFEQLKQVYQKAHPRQQTKQEGKSIH